MAFDLLLTTYRLLAGVLFCQIGDASLTPHFMTRSGVVFGFKSLRLLWEVRRAARLFTASSSAIDCVCLDLLYYLLFTIYTSSTF